MGGLGGLIGLASKLGNLTRWLKAWSQGQDADRQLRALEVGQEATIRLPDEVDVRFRSKNKAKRFEFVAVVVKRLPDKAKGSEVTPSAGPAGRGAEPTP